MEHSQLMGTADERLLLVQSEQSPLPSPAKMLANAGYTVEIAKNARRACEMLLSNGYDLILFELLPEMPMGLESIHSLREADSRMVLVVLAPGASSDQAIDAVRLGANDVVTQVDDASSLLFAVRKACERKHLRIENETLRQQVNKRYSFSNIIAQSDSMDVIFETIKKVSDYKTSVLLSGESGTGKELIARAIHHNSSRRKRRFVAINCGAIPENLLESELFGHCRGAFTDATKDKKGLFEEADGGTIFLDEIGELPPHLQVKLLRVLQENEIRPVGATHPVAIDVRVIAATLRDLEDDIIAGRFRDDLYYRLNVVNIRIPPLRERKEDIPILVNYFMKKNQDGLGLAVYGIEKEALAQIIAHPWPGNVRELENCIERAMILAEKAEITLENLPNIVLASSEETSPLLISEDQLSIKVNTRVLEQSLIRKALEQTNGNRTHAAKLLEISHRTLLYKLKEYKLS